ncbi:MAG: phosphatidylserine decarboxylase [Alphaproteobacteria bacterium]|nr:phosphatidylserine decarboxylase [Alphaproteobacteria bacterium]
MTSKPELAEVAPEGWPMLAAAGVITILLAFIALPLAGVAVGLMVWLRHILRVPARKLPANAEHYVLAPADGVITSIGMPRSQADAQALGDRPLGSTSTGDPMAGDPMARLVRITIKTRLSDAQLQCAPVSGRVRDNFLIPGLFLSAADEVSARRDNERREVTIETDEGDAIMLVQIGTRTARQLICRHSPGRTLAAGAPLGMARLAGLTDVFVPADCGLAVQEGQSVLAGETILATFAGSKGRAGQRRGPAGR